MAEPMTLTIITPDAVVYDGKANFFVGRAIDGEFGVLSKSCTYDYRPRCGAITH